MVDDTPRPQQPQVGQRQQPAPHRRRPYDIVVEAGPPADPIVFPQPRIFRGRRGEVCCYNPKTQDHEMAKNVLFRDFSREFEDGDARVTQAYWPLPYKKPIRTIMGHVEICMVLTRGTNNQDGNNFEDSSSEEDEDEDIIFELTEEMVAVKVNYSQRMEELRHRHAEDPLKEIAAMQIIGDEHPNVMGCRDVLFDGQSLNVVMTYCGSGKLSATLSSLLIENC